MDNLLQHFTEQLPAALEFLEAMVTMESPTFDKELVDKFVRFVGSRFSEIGGEVQYVATDRFGDHLILRFNASSRDRVLLLGHTDTVWPTGEISKRPFKIENGRATGPGVFDMKAGILLMWMAAAVWKKPV